MDLTEADFKGAGDSGDTFGLPLKSGQIHQNGTQGTPKVQIQETVQDAIDKEKQDLGCHLANMRVQALRNEEYFSSSGVSSSAYTTEDDDESRDAHLGEFVPPSEELANKIIKQVESMFSDSFVYRDAFMMKHIRRGAGGYVSLRLITSIRKVKSLSQDFRVVGHALRGSKELEVNQDNTKVRRVKPLPESFDSGLAQTILLTGVPKDPTMHENVDEAIQLISSLLKPTNSEEKQSALSNIPSVRIIKESTHVPTTYKSQHSSLFNFDLGFCILLDFFGFEKLNVADIRNLLCPSDSTVDAWKLQIGIYELPSIKADPSRRKNRKVKDSLHPDVVMEREFEKAPRIQSFTPAKASPSFSSRRSTPHSPSSRLDASGGSNSRLNVSSPWSSPGSSPRASPCFKRRTKPGPSPLTTGVVNSSGGESPAGSPWMTRRSWVQSDSSPASSSQSVLRRSGNLDSEFRIGRCVVVKRSPRGPDEGKGFQLLRTLG